MKVLCNNPKDAILSPAQGCPGAQRSHRVPAALLPEGLKQLLPERLAEQLPDKGLLFHPLTRNIQTQALLPGCINHRSSSPFPAPWLAQATNQSLDFHHILIPGSPGCWLILQILRYQARALFWVSTLATAKPRQGFPKGNAERARVWKKRGYFINKSILHGQKVRELTRRGITWQRSPSPSLCLPQPRSRAALPGAGGFSAVLPIQTGPTMPRSLPEAGGERGGPGAIAVPWGSMQCCK